MTTQTPAPEAVAARLEALERQVGEVLPKNRTVEAEKVLLRDRQGTVRAWLGLLADGSPGLMLVDREGQGGIALSAAADGAAALGFYDPAGRARVRLAVETDGARLVLYDPGGRVIARLPAAPGAAGEEVRIAVEDVPSEGEALLSRIGRTVSAWVARSRSQAVSGLWTDARRIPAELLYRAQRAIRDLDARRAVTLATLEEHATGFLEAALTRLNVVVQGEVADLQRRTTRLEQRLDALVRERAA